LNGVIYTTKRSLLASQRQDKKSTPILFDIWLTSADIPK